MIFYEWGRTNNIFRHYHPLWTESAVFSGWDEMMVCMSDEKSWGKANPDQNYHYD